MVRAVVLGDSQTGKSSMINCFISNAFEEHVTSVIPVAVIPPEGCPEGVSLTLVDTSASEIDRLEEEICKADVAIVLYAADRPDTLTNVSLRWIPIVLSKNGALPIIVVGNKVDLRSGDAQSIDKDLRSAASPIMELFKQVETCIECSAKKMINISEVMLFACKAVLHPSAPLYHGKTQSLQPDCAKALRRIFELCDEDQDQLLSDTELNKFQNKCFGSSLQNHQLRSIKDVIRRNVQDGVSEKGVQLAGFMFLHELFIQRGRAETTWAVLRAFGYGSDLRIDKKFLPDLEEYHADQNFELSESAFAFVHSLFLQCDMDKDGALSQTELATLFERAPGIPWTDGRGAPTDANGNLTWGGYVALWAATCLLAPRDALEWLVYLGYGGGREDAAQTALWVSPRRSAELKKKKSSRSVFNVLLSCAGLHEQHTTSAFLRGTFNKDPNQPDPPSPATDAVLGVPPSSGQTKGSKKSSGGVQLLVSGRSPTESMTLLRSPPKKGTAAYDAIVLMYNAHEPNSFESCVRVMDQVTEQKLLIPYLIASVHRDGEPQATQMVDGAPVTVSEFCAQRKLQPPISVSFSGGLASLDGLTQLVASSCVEPHTASPAIAAHLRQTAYMATVATCAAWAVLLAGAGLFVFVRAKQKRF